MLELILAHLSSGDGAVVLIIALVALFWYALGEGKRNNIRLKAEWYDEMVEQRRESNHCKACGKPLDKQDKRNQPL